MVRAFSRFSRWTLRRVLSYKSRRTDIYTSNSDVMCNNILTPSDAVMQVFSGVLGVRRVFGLGHRYLPYVLIEEIGDGEWSFMTADYVIRESLNDFFATRKVREFRCQDDYLTKNRYPGLAEETNFRQFFVFGSRMQLLPNGTLFQCAQRILFKDESRLSQNGVGSAASFHRRKRCSLEQVHRSLLFQP